MGKSRMRNTKTENTVVVRVMPSPQKAGNNAPLYLILSLPTLQSFKTIGKGNVERKTILPATMKGQAVKMENMVLKVCFLARTYAKNYIMTRIAMAALTEPQQAALTLKDQLSSSFFNFENIQLVRNNAKDFEAMSKKMASHVWMVLLSMRTCSRGNLQLMILFTY